MPQSLQTIPAPVGGWTTTSANVVDLPNLFAFGFYGDSLQSKPNTALILDNLIPAPGYVTNRLGASTFATGVGMGNVDSLFELKAGTVNKFIAASGGAFYDITAGGTATLLASGFNSNQWVGTSFDGELALVNGIDHPQTYNGTSISPLTISGPASVNNLIAVKTYQERTYYALKNSQSFWYTTAGGIGGSLTEFPLGEVGNFGGNLIGIEVLTTDGGTGMQDYICFFMSTGEIIMYSGNDPGNNFSIVGIYVSGRPINQRGIIKYGPDVLVITDSGYITLSSLLPLSYGKDNTALGYAIRGAASAAVQAFGSSFGWQAIVSPCNNLLLINVPQNNNTFVQHVLNTNTTGWCRFTNLNARCWCNFSETLYFGGTNGTVYMYGPNYTDYGSNATYIYQSLNLRLSAGQAQTAGIRPRLLFNGQATLSIQQSVDLQQLSPSYSISYTPNGAVWGDPWGSPWASPTSITNYLNFNNTGYLFSVYLTITTGAQLFFYETDFVLNSAARI
jgi:hypothetical protein